MGIFRKNPDEFSIKPIVAVVPKNVDDYLNRKEYDPLFWEKVTSLAI